MRTKNLTSTFFLTHTPSHFVPYIQSGESENDYCFSSCVLCS